MVSLTSLQAEASIFLGGWGEAMIRIGIEEGKLVGGAMVEKDQSDWLDVENADPGLRACKIPEVPVVFGF